MPFKYDITKDYLYQLGRKIGREIAIYKMEYPKCYEMIQRMLNKGLDTKLIAEVMGETEDFIKGIQIIEEKKDKCDSIKK